MARSQPKAPLYHQAGEITFGYERWPVTALRFEDIISCKRRRGHISLLSEQVMAGRVLLLRLTASSRSPLPTSGPSLPARLPQFALVRPCRTSFASTTLRCRSFASSTAYSAKMKAILIKDGKGPAENLYLGEEETPSPGKGQVQVKVRCPNVAECAMELIPRRSRYDQHHTTRLPGSRAQTFGLNRMDLLQREGKYPLPPQASKTIMGVEFAGVVSQVGEGASTYKEGDEVFGLAFGVSGRIRRHVVR